LTAAFDAGPAPMLVCFGLAVLYWLFLGVLISALKGVYTAALYAHTTQKPYQGLPPELVAGAFRER